MRLMTTGRVVLTLLVAFDVQARQVDSRRIPYRPWDLNASVGLHLSNTRAAGALSGGYD